MRMASTKYRKIMSDLDNLGVTTNIERVGPKWYEVHVDFEIIKKYRKRDSANKFIVRLLKSKQCE